LVLGGPVGGLGTIVVQYRWSGGRRTQKLKHV